MSKHRTTVFFDSELRSVMQKVSKDDGRPMSWHQEKAFRAYGPYKKLLADKLANKSGKAIADNMSLAAPKVWIIPVPEGINLTAWHEWVEAKGSKLTKAAKTKQWKLLLNYSDADQQAIIDASINSGWQGLFPLKGNQPVQSGRPDDFIEKNTNSGWREGL